MYKNKLGEEKIKGNNQSVKRQSGPDITDPQKMGSMNRKHKFYALHHGVRAYAALDSGV